MTTEDEFQALLDANPDDHGTRLVFADWLQERDDPRAEGYRALGVMRRWPRCDHARGHFSFANETVVKRDGGINEHAPLPRDWFSKLVKKPKRLRTGPKIQLDNWRDFDLRRSAEDAAALAFSKLPAARRAELLAACSA